jgi:uncharacterized protein YfiM (DUF2279 family)
VRRLALLLFLLAGAAHAQDADPWLGPDKALHFAATGVISAGGYGVGALIWDEPAPRLLTDGVLAMGAGVGKELLDLAGLGHPSWRDLAWDAIGTASGLLIAWAVDRAIQALFPERVPRPWPQNEVVSGTYLP